MNLPSDGKVVAWLGFGFGSVVSIAANVLHAWIPQPPEGAPESWVPPLDWAPSPAAQLGAAVWPIALLLSVEAISRVRWRSGWWWNFARFGGLGVVGLGSFAISYGHLYEVLTTWGYGPGAYVGPIVIDGLMVVSGFALLSESGTSAQPTARTATPKPRQWVVDAIERKADGSQVEKVVEVAPEPATKKGEPAVSSLDQPRNRRAAGLEWARAEWPVTGGQIAKAIGVSKGEADRIRAMVKKEREEAAS